MVTYKNFLVTFAEFLGYFCGISWLPLRNFLVTFAEFLGYLWLLKPLYLLGFWHSVIK